MDIFQLAGKIVVDTVDANKALDDTVTKGNESKNKLVKSFRAIGAAAIAAFSVKRIVNFGNELAKAAASTADTIDKMSQKIGISRTAYQELDYVMSQSGASIDTMQRGMKTLVSKMESGADAFDTLGVSVKDSNGEMRSSEAVMWEAMAALQGVQNQTEKAALATTLFGTAGTELMPLLNSQVGSIDELRQKAHDLGIVMSDEAVDAGVNYTDAMDDLNRQMQDLKNTLGASLLPSITEFITKLSEFLGREDTQQKISDIAAKLGELAGLAFDGLIAGLEWLTNEGNLQLLTGALEALGIAFAAAGIATMIANLNPLSLAISAIALAVGAIVANWNKVTSAINKAIEAVKSFLGLTGGSSSNMAGGANVGEDGTIFDPALGYSRDGGLTWGFANGLEFVPRDQFPAILHYGEAVLNRTDAKAWRDGSGSGGMMQLADKMDIMINAITNGFSGMGSQQIVLDSGALVGSVAHQMDARLGRISSYRGRQGR